MLVITSSISKKELLQKLAAVANEKEKLIVTIASLPTFLATPIAFTIFNYQISNYPRKIFWTSKEQPILEFLNICQVDIDQPEEEIANIVVIKANPDETKPDLDSSDLKNKQESNYSEAEFTDIKTEIKETPVNDSFATSDLESFSDSFFYGAKNKISAEDLLKKDNYSPSSLFDKNFDNFDIKNIYTNHNAEDKKLNTPSRPNSDALEEQILLNYKPEVVETKEEADTDPNFDQNLDNWLEKIEATRMALSGLKQQDQKQIRKPSFFLKSVQFATTLVLLSALIVGFYVIFPTNVYSVDVVAQKKNAQTTIDLPVSKFLTQSRNLTETGQTPGTGIEIVNLNQSRGKVLLVNKSGGPISFNRNGIILISSTGGEYRQLAVSGDPATYVVPGRSNVVGGNVEISIQATKDGSEFNLAKDTVLKIYNLNRDLIGGLFTAVVTEEVNTSKASGKKIIQSQDLKKLQQENLLKLEKKSQTELGLIANETTFTDPKWYNLSEIIDVFTHASGDIAETVGVTTTAKSKLFYLNNNLLNDELIAVNSDMSKLLTVNKVEYTGDFSRLDSKIQITVDYQYSQKTDINETDLVNKLSGENFDKNKTELKQNYPQITEIKKQEQGLRLPGIPARVNVNIDQGN